MVKHAQEHFWWKFGLWILQEIERKRNLRHLRRKREYCTRKYIFKYIIYLLCYELYLVMGAVIKNLIIFHLTIHTYIIYLYHCTRGKDGNWKPWNNLHLSSLPQNTDKGKGFKLVLLNLDLSHLKCKWIQNRRVRVDEKKRENIRIFIENLKKFIPHNIV